MKSLPADGATPSRPYKFGFVLSTTIGNMTRYQNLRKYAERDSEVECTWAPVNHYMPERPAAWLALLPESLSMRFRLLEQAQPVMGRFEYFDAVMVHLFEVDILLSLRGYFKRRPLHVSSTDEAPITNRATYPLYPRERNKPAWRHWIRLKIDLWRVRNTDLFIPFSHWVANVLTRDCKAPPAVVHPLHVGMDLEAWSPPAVFAREENTRPKILFVGADFSRKGGDLLLEVFREHFQHHADLHLVSKQAPKELPPNVFIHSDFQPNDRGLTELYGQVDILAVPTTADTGPLWVFMEAMAMHLPIIGTDTGSNTELVRDGETGLIVPIGDGTALKNALKSLIDDKALRTRLGNNGRALIEKNYDARVNVPKILKAMKEGVDLTRAKAKV